MAEQAISSGISGKEELHSYLANPKFSQRITCPRTSLSVSLSQTGDPEGCPVLFIPPAVCSRWFCVPLGEFLTYEDTIRGGLSGLREKETITDASDQLCRDSGIKLISIDRPGCGSTPAVPIEERLDVSSSKSTISGLDQGLTTRTYDLGDGALENGA
jgi:hypothetical protein